MRATVDEEPPAERGEGLVDSVQVLDNVGSELQVAEHPDDIAGGCPFTTGAAVRVSLGSPPSSLEEGSVGIIVPSVDER
jgi:hypothetical protein